MNTQPPSYQAQTAYGGYATQQPNPPTGAGQFQPGYQVVNTHPQTSLGPGESAASKAATKGTAYGGSEVGSLLGGAVGPPIIGNVVGGIVGEKLGEKGATKFGIDEAAGKMSNDLAKVVGQRNVDKMGEIAQTALGYSAEEECVCCSCMPASQILFFIMSGFFCFNFYRMSVGIDYDWSCSSNVDSSEIIEVDNDQINDTLREMYTVSENLDTNTTVFLKEYPCEWGFHYLTSGAAVWLAFLPFYITQLLGNCWRQCCCCLCDPLVCFACCVDIIKRYCCECGRFNIISFIWHAMCLFQVVWSFIALKWLLSTVYFQEDDYKNWDPHLELTKAVLASICLDVLLAGSELFHKVRLEMRKRRQTTEAAQEVEMLNHPPPPQSRA